MTGFLWPACTGGLLYCAHCISQEMMQPAVSYEGGKLLMLRVTPAAAAFTHVIWACQLQVLAGLRNARWFGDARSRLQ